MHQATIFQERWSLSAWKLLPTRQLAEASHPMSPSYSGKLLMIALVIRPQSSINTRRHTHTRASVYCSLSPIHIPSRPTYVRGWRLSSTSFCSYICSYEVQPRPSAPETRWISARSVELPKETSDDLSLPVIELSCYLLCLHGSPPLLHCTWLWSRAVTSMYLRSSEEPVLDTIERTLRCRL